LIDNQGVKKCQSKVLFLQGLCGATPGVAGKAIASFQPAPKIELGQAAIGFSLSRRR
jgi:hypothetical protein